MNAKHSPPQLLYCKKCEIYFKESVEVRGNDVIWAVLVASIVGIIYALSIVNGQKSKGDPTGDQFLGGCLLIISMPAVIVALIVGISGKLKHEVRRQRGCPNCKTVAKPEDVYDANNHHQDNMQS